MKKLIYTGAFALLTLGFVACSEAVDELEDVADDLEMVDDDALTEEKLEEMNSTIELQEETEALDDELNKYIEEL